MRPSLLALAVLSLALPSRIAAQAASMADVRTPPRLMFTVAPLTAFPDPVAVSLAVNPRPGIMLEGGAALVVPGAFVRAGLAFPVARSAGRGTDLLAYAGYRAHVLPLMDPMLGPAAGFGIRRWVRGGWGFQVNTGLWFTEEYVDCVGDCSGRGNRLILPEVRLAGIRSR
jgi:hypothetical protein